MAITVALNPNQSIDDSPKRYFGLSTDTKPTVASHSGLPTPTTGSTFLETDTGDVYVTYDGTNWVICDSTYARLVAIETAVEIIDNMISGSEAQVDVVGALPAGTARIGTVSGVLKTVSVTKALIGGAYSAKDVLSESATDTVGTSWLFAAIARANAAYGYIAKARVISETTALTPRLSLFLYKAVPTCELDDNAANTAPKHADLANYIGRIDFPSMEAANLSAAGDSEAMVVPGSYNGLPLAFQCASDADDLYGVLVTWDGFTQGAGDDMTVELTVEQY